MPAEVVAVCARSTHAFSKHIVERIELEPGRGVKGDAHYGETVQHVFDVRRNPNKLNLRQVHLVEVELLEELGESGFDLIAGSLGENIVTRGIALDVLPLNTRLNIGDEVVLLVTGLREPCVMIDRFKRGLRAAVTVNSESTGRAVRRAIMATVLRGGVVEPKTIIRVDMPPDRQPLSLV